MNLTLIEDNRAESRLFELILSRIESNYNLQVFASGQKARNYLESLNEVNLPDGIVMDFNTPELSGLEFLHWIKQEEKFKNIPVVILTASTDSEEMLKVEALGYKFFLKEFGLEENEKTLKEIISLFNSSSLKRG